MSSRLEYTFNLSEDDKELIKDLEKAESDGESPEDFPKTKGGQIILTIDQKKSAVNDIDWPTLNDLLLSVVEGKEEE